MNRTNPLKSYISSSFPINEESQLENFSNEDLNLIDVSRILHSLSTYNQKYQEITYSNELFSQMGPGEKFEMFNQIISLHKMLSHFILKNKEMNVS